MNVPGLVLHFLRPWWWLALAPLPLLLWMLARSGGGRAALSRLVDAALLPHLVRDAAPRTRMALGLFALGWILAVAALAGPAWRKLATPLYVNGAARVVVLSLANDMLAQDVKPDRMTRARFLVRDLLEGAGDARTALVAYAGEAFTVAPLTDDKRTVLNFLQALRPDIMPVAGNDAAAGIRRGVELLQQAHVSGGEIVLVTDGAKPAAAAAARAAHDLGIRVDVLGVGTSDGAPVPRSGGGFVAGADGVLMARRDDASLRAVAHAGGGRYAVLGADGSGAEALAAPVAAVGHADQGEQAQLWRDGGAWLLPILVLLAALAFRRGWLLVVACMVLPAAIPTAQASTWSSLWSSHDQRALQALQRGDVRQAQALASTSGMRGAAAYRAGDYAAAARAFSRRSDARSRYNLGNALARQGQYHQAIDAYQQALQEDPHLADARANLEAVQAWLDRHPASPPSGAAGQSGPDGKGQQSGPSPAPAGASPPPSGHDPARPGGQQGQASADPSGAPGTAVQRQPGQGTRPNGSAPSRVDQNDRGSDQAVGASTGEAARQQAQAQQARRDLAKALAGARDGKSHTDAGGQHAFALGQSEPHGDSPFNASQRAMLHAVPDDPGALLRRKFKLEWEQRQGRQQEGPP